MAEPNITVERTELDSYGNLWVYPTGGGEKIKIGEKRSNLHQLFQPGLAVALTWDSYNNKPYVSDAKLMSEALPPPVKVEAPKAVTGATPPPAPKPAPAPPQPSTRAGDTESNRIRSMAFAYVKDLKCALIRAGVIKEMNQGELLSMFQSSELIASYIKGEFIVDTK